MSGSAHRDASDDCEHAEFELHPDSFATDVDPATVPYGRSITQRARCIACGYGLERRLRVDGWTPWQTVET